MRIIAKKVRAIGYSKKDGLIRPVFEMDELGNYKQISADKYPNNGQIFVGDYELLDLDIKNDLFLMDSDFFISDDHNYQDRSTDINACQKRIRYNSGISSFFKLISPQKLISIYSNEFSLLNNVVESPDNIKSDIFFLKDLQSELLFGPFERDGKELKAANFKNYDEQFDDEQFIDFIDKYDIKYGDSVIFEISIEKASNFIVFDNDNFEYLEDFKVFIDKNIGTAIDFTPIAELHKWAINKLKQNTPKIATSLEDIKNIISSNKTEYDKLKWTKYIEHLENIQKDDDDIDQLVKILNDKNFIPVGADKSETEKLEKDNKALENENGLKGDEIRVLKDKIAEINEELEKFKTKTQEYNNIDPLIFPHLAKALSMPEDILEIENIIIQGNSSNTLKTGNTNLLARKDVLEEDIKKLEESKRSINESVRLIKQNFDSDVSVHTAKLADAKMYTDLLNGINIPSKSLKEVGDEYIPNIIVHTKELNNAKLYVSEIQKRLLENGRKLSFNDVTNLVLTINQSFLTIIAGAPGVGKTSLVEKLSKSYGLNEKFGYLEIACAKGWTSSKDLIGFFNPLSNVFQPAKTKLKDALQKSEDYPHAPYIVLLDEANLSPIEHYWSDFIKLADLNYPRNIKISDSKEIKFGKGFRFVATINHDHTTEALSNRLIDRASIIQLDKPDKNSIVDAYMDDKVISSIFNLIELENLFTPTSKWKSDATLIENTLEGIKEKIEKNNTGIIISPRKHIAILKYCKVATGLLEGNSYVALDYAVSQHILPLINGRGEDFEKMLYSLKEDLNSKGMAKSEKLLNKIIERGKEFKHFRYIYY
jgi:MoxR-like ATPase